MLDPDNQDMDPLDLEDQCTAEATGDGIFDSSEGWDLVLCFLPSLDENLDGCELDCME
jgi:hypothetical protein